MSKNFKPDDIRKLRAVKKMTQKQLAKKVAVSVSAVKQWEAGARKPSPPVMLLLEFLEIDKY